jgi:Fe-Mn family superoxide dismutase
MTGINSQKAPFELPTLDYAQDALAPSISEETMRYHYGKHHATYINNLNNLVKGTEFESATLEKIILSAEGAIFNNAAQTWNHTFYFTAFSSEAKPKPEGALLEAIERDFGSFSSFIERFSASAVGLFGAGWTWLVQDESGKLSIINTTNAANPMKEGLKPLLVVDVWEHAYYIDYRNVRADAVRAVWNIIDWAIIEKRFK